MLPPAPPPEPLPPPLVFLKAEKSFCHRDLLLAGVVIGGADAVDGVFDGVSDRARDVSEEVEFENWREPLAK